MINYIHDVSFWETRIFIYLSLLEGNSDGKDDCRNFLIAQRVLWRPFPPSCTSIPFPLLIDSSHGTSVNDESAWGSGLTVMFHHVFGSRPTVRLFDEILYDTKWMSVVFALGSEWLRVSTQRSCMEIDPSLKLHLTTLCVAVAANLYPARKKKTACQ